MRNLFLPFISFSFSLPWNCFSLDILFFARFFLTATNHEFSPNPAYGFSLTISSLLLFLLRQNALTYELVTRFPSLTIHLLYKNSSAILIVATTDFMPSYVIP